MVKYTEGEKKQQKQKRIEKVPFRLKLLKIDILSSIYIYVCAQHTW